MEDREAKRATVGNTPAIDRRIAAPPPPHKIENHYDIEAHRHGRKSTKNDQTTTSFVHPP
jgi:hypothetical protein